MKNLVKFSFVLTLVISSAVFANGQDFAVKVNSNFASSLEDFRTSFSVDKERLSTKNIEANLYLEESYKISRRTRSYIILMGISAASGIAFTKAHSSTSIGLEHIGERTTYGILAALSFSGIVTFGTLAITSNYKAAKFRKTGVELLNSQLESKRSKRTDETSIRLGYTPKGATLQYVF